MSYIIEVDTKDKVQRFQVAERILRYYEAADISTSRAFELLERLYVGQQHQAWLWPDVYVTSDPRKENNDV